MKAFKWLPLLLAALVLLVSACATTETESPQPAEQAPEPAVETEAVDTAAEIEAAEAAEAAAQLEAAEALAAAQAAEAAVRDQFVSTHVYFDFDSIVLRPESQELLQVKGLWLLATPDVTAVIIEGHCDDRGTDAYNMALGARRAEVVKQYLIDFGIDQVELETQSFGEEQPVDYAQNEEAWAKNRRAVFVIN